MCSSKLWNKSSKSKKEPEKIFKMTLPWGHIEWAGENVNSISDCKRWQSDVPPALQSEQIDRSCLRMWPPLPIGFGGTAACFTINNCGKREGEEEIQKDNTVQLQRMNDLSSESRPFLAPFSLIPIPHCALSNAKWASPARNRNDLSIVGRFEGFLAPQVL